jgi:hypothetical protein
VQARCDGVGVSRGSGGVVIKPGLVPGFVAGD